MLLDRRDPVEGRIDQTAVRSRPAVDDVGRAVLRIEPVVPGASEERVGAGAAVQLIPDLRAVGREGRQCVERTAVGERRDAGSVSCVLPLRSPFITQIWLLEPSDDLCRPD